MTHPDRIRAALEAIQRTDPDLLRPRVRRWGFRAPLPPRGLGQNFRLDHIKRARLTREYRQEVVAAIHRDPEPRPWTEPLRRSAVLLTAAYSRSKPKRNPDGTWPAEYMAWQDRYRPTDVDNLVAACKALIDALGCSGLAHEECAMLIAGDRAEQMELRKASIVEVADWRDEGVYVVIQEVR